MVEKNNNEIIDLHLVTRKIWDKRQTFYKVLPIVFVLSCIYIFSLPRYYKSEIKLAPEIDNSISEGALGSIASSFGFDIGSMATTDAISPELYPELLETNDFITLLFPMEVEDYDHTLHTTYFDYLKKHQKTPWWSFVSKAIRSILPKEKEQQVGSSAEFNPLNLNKKQDVIASIIKGNISCSIDRKTSMITITVTDQDRRICATIADSIRLKLQEFITDYRTKKARIDVEYFRNLVNESRNEYDEARHRYANYTDSHRNIKLENFISIQNDLENDMEVKFNNYTAYNTQLQAAIAKLQQRTPAFTLLQGASIPVKPAGPKRIIFIFVMLILSSMIIAARILLKSKN